MCSAGREEEPTKGAAGQAHVNQQTENYEHYSSVSSRRVSRLSR